MLVIPGAEYISSCLWPFRSIYSIAAKSFLSSIAFFLNSDLGEIFQELKGQCVE